MAEASLLGQTAVVTGAYGGLGSELCRQLLEAGANVVGVGRSQDKLAELSDRLAEFQGSFRTAPLDVADEERVGAFFQDLDRVDLLINAAGAVHWAPFLETSKEDLERVLAANLTGAFLMMKGAARLMAARGSGLIINVASVAALKGLDHMGPYSASKFALRGLTQAAALELRGKGIRVSLFCPGQIDTPMLGSGPHPSAMRPADAAKAIVAMAALPSALEIREIYVEPLGLEGA